LRFSDILWSAFRSLGRRKLRAGLMALGVAIGIAAMIALLSLSKGFEVSITSRIVSTLTLDTLIVMPSTGENSIPIYVNDTSMIDNVDGVVLSTPIINRKALAFCDSKPLEVSISGVNFSEFKAIRGEVFKAESGSIPDNPNNNTVVLGHGVAYPISLNDEKFASVGDEIILSVMVREGSFFVIKNYTFVVSAILEESGEVGPEFIDYSVFIPLNTAIDVFDCDEASLILVKVENYKIADNVAEKIEDLYSGNVLVISPKAVIRQTRRIFAIIDVFLGGIAAVSLFVAGVGIMNIMLVSVFERTREIGVLKALGAKDSTVLMLFLSESMIIGVVGGCVGIILGVALSKVLSELMRMGLFPLRFGEALKVTPIYEPITVLSCIGFAILICIIFSLYPAWIAAKKEPVKALRYE